MRACTLAALSAVYVGGALVHASVAKSGTCPDHSSELQSNEYFEWCQVSCPEGSSFNISFEYVDQGHGNWKGRLRADDPASGETIWVSDVAPHKWIHTNAVLFGPTTGANVSFKYKTGADGGHELHVRNFVWSWSANSPPAAPPLSPPRNPPSPPDVPTSSLPFVAELVLVVEGTAEDLSEDASTLVVLGHTVARLLGVPTTRITVRVLLGSVTIIIEAGAESRADAEGLALALQEKLPNASVASAELGMSVLSLEVTVRELSSFPTAAVAGGSAAGVVAVLLLACGIALYLQMYIRRLQRQAGQKHTAKRQWRISKAVLGLRAKRSREKTPAQPPPPHNQGHGAMAEASAGGGGGLLGGVLGFFANLMGGGASDGGGDERFVARALILGQPEKAAAGLRVALGLAGERSAPNPRPQRSPSPSPSPPPSPSFSILILSPQPHPHPHPHPHLSPFTPHTSALTLALTSHPITLQQPPHPHHSPASPPPLSPHPSPSPSPSPRTSHPYLGRLIRSPPRLPSLSLSTPPPPPHIRRPGLGPTAIQRRVGSCRRVQSLRQCRRPRESPLLPARHCMLAGGHACTCTPLYTGWQLSRRQDQRG